MSNHVDTCNYCKYMFIGGWRWWYGHSSYQYFVTAWISIHEENTRCETAKILNQRRYDLGKKICRMDGFELYEDEWKNPNMSEKDF